MIFPPGKIPSHKYSMAEGSASVSRSFLATVSIASYSVSGVSRGPCFFQAFLDTSCKSLFFIPELNLIKRTKSFESLLSLERRRIQYVAKIVVGSRGV